MKGGKDCIVRGLTKFGIRGRMADELRRVRQCHGMDKSFTAESSKLGIPKCTGKDVSYRYLRCPELGLTDHYEYQ